MIRIPNQFAFQISTESDQYQDVVRYSDGDNFFFNFQQRHRTDRQVNNRKSHVLRKGQLVEEKWHRVQVG